MTSLMDIVFQYHKDYYYIILPIVLILQSIGIPVGGTVIIIFTGALSYIMHKNIFYMGTLVWIFTALADGISFLFWRKFGNSLIAKPWKISKFILNKISIVEKYFSKYGKLVIIITRFPVGALGPFTNIFAGISKYSFKTFFLLCILGEFVWSWVYISLGYWFGDGWEAIYNIISEFTQLITLIVLLITVIYVIIFKLELFSKIKKSKNN